MDEPSHHAEQNSYETTNEPYTSSSSLNNGKNIQPNNNLIITFFDKKCEIKLSDPDKHTVINLSSCVFTDHKISLMEKRDKFCPTPGEPDIQEIKSDLSSSFRRMNLKATYHDPTSAESQTLENHTQPTIDQYLTHTTQSTTPDCSADDLIHLKFKPKSTFNPNPHDPVLETFYCLIEEDVNQYTPRNPRVQNLTKHEREAYKKICQNPYITIKRADKGSALVIMDTVDYINKSERQLYDTNVYVETRTNLTATHIISIKEILDEMLENEEIDEKTYSILCPPYFLLKIHKKQVKGRHIISGNGCPTEQISAFVDEHIKEYVTLFPSYVKDSPDFIRKFENFSSRNEIILVTMDLTGLYSYIANQERITAVYRTLQGKHRENKSIQPNQAAKSSPPYEQLRVQWKTLPPNRRYRNGNKDSTLICNGNKDSSLICKYLHGTSRKATP